MWLFRGLAIVAIPLLFLFGSEGLLRLGGYGYSPRFIRERQQSGQAVWTENLDFGRRFFPPGLVRCAQLFTIPAVKPPQTLRVFVLGESAAMGDPDFKFGLPRMLDRLLSERYPDRRIEVINAAMVAINSHVILPIAEDCARCQADLWVVYMGNNEIIGPFGSASVFGAKAPALSFIRFGLWAKSTRLGQLLESVIYWARQSDHPLPEWRGMEMMAGQRIPHDAPATQRVYQHFERNLEDILETGARAGVPIVLCTVATNLKDCAPFASAHRMGLSPAELLEWQRAYEAGVALQSRGEMRPALASYEQAVRLDNEFAELAFRRGVCHQQLGELRPAEALFRQAREQDALQFRADDRINTIIRQSAEAHANRRVSLVDADKLFAAKSSGGLTGGELFYEHVHLVPEANYLLAQAVAQRAEEALSLKGSRPWPSLADCLHLLGFTDWNRYDALDVILDRIQSAPFTNQVNHADQIQKINEQREHFRSASKPAQLRREAAEVGALLNRYPEDPDLRWNLAMLFETAGDTAGAEAQWRALLALQPRATLPVFNLAKLLEGGNRPAEALALYLDCLNKDPEYYPARYAAGRLCLESHSTDQALRHLKLALRQKPGAIEARLALAQALAQAGNKSGAEMQVRQILRLDPNNPSARRYLGELRPGSPEP